MPSVHEALGSTTSIEKKKKKRERRKERTEGNSEGRKRRKKRREGMRKEGERRELGLVHMGMRWEDRHKYMPSWAT